MKDMINRPEHYSKGGIDVIDFMTPKISEEAMEGFFQVNIIKYVTRYNDKGGLQDLQKAKYYLNKLIEMKEGNMDDRL